MTDISSLIEIGPMLLYGFAILGFFQFLCYWVKYRNCRCCCCCEKKQGGK